MRLTHKLIFLGITLLISLSEAKRWNTNKDSVIVDSQFWEEESDQPLADESIEKVECLTDDGQPGECVTMIRCHPILFSEKGQVRNAGLAITYSQISTDSCSSQNSLDGEFDPIQNGQNSSEIGNKVVCCAKDRIQYNERSDLSDDLELYSTTIDTAQDAPETSTSVPLTLEQEIVQTTQVPEDNVLVVDTANSNGQSVSPVIDVEIVEDVVTVKPSLPAAEVPQSEPHPEVEPEPEAKTEIVPEVPSIPVTNNPESEEPISVTTTQIPASESAVIISEEDSPQTETEIVTPDFEQVIEQKPPTQACPSTANYRTWPVFYDYPWLATIQTRAKTGPTCSGSLITESHVLTAAHCLHRFNSRDVARMQIRLGFSKRGENDTFNDYWEERKASKIIFHKRFHEQSKMDNNIALIKLDQPVEFNDHIAPIGVFNGLKGFDGGNCSAIEAGWIKFGNRKVTGISGGVIQFIEAPVGDFHLRESLSRVFNSEECQLNLNSQINEKMLCAKSKLFEEPNVSTDFFRWNDGGPLVVQAGNIIQQIGIKSWAYEGQQYPTVYTRVDSYLDWIRDNLKM